MYDEYVTRYLVPWYRYSLLYSYGLSRYLVPGTQVTHGCGLTRAFLASIAARRARFCWCRFPCVCAR